MVPRPSADLKGRSPRQRPAGHRRSVVLQKRPGVAGGSLALPAGATHLPPAGRAFQICSGHYPQVAQRRPAHRHP